MTSLGFGDLIINSVTYLLENPSILAVGFLLCVFIFALSMFIYGPRPGPNPFKTDSTRPVKPIELNQNVRDKVIKQGFNLKKIPDSLDAIVVGSGIGGLTVANVLARAGKKVLVLEQHDQAGGCCHTFIDKGFEFDVGIHYIGEMRRKDESRILMDQMTNGQLQWEALSDCYDIVALGKPGKYKLYPQLSGRATWQAKMLEKFPNEEKAIDKYIELLKDVERNFLGMVAFKVKPKWITKLLILTGLLGFFTRKYFKYASVTTEEMLNEITDNADLRAVLTYNFGDYGTHPGRSSFVMAASLANHFAGGAFYPRGGSSEIAYHLIPPIEEAGGRVLVRAPVSNILCKDGAAVGVRIIKSGNQVDIHAPLIVSDAGVINTFKTLLPVEEARKTGIYKFIQNKGVEAGIGAISLFVGLKGTTEELNLKSQNMWVLSDNDLGKMVDDFMEKDLEDVLQGTDELPLLFIAFPSPKDSAFNDRFPGKSTCTVVTLCNWGWFEAWKDEPVMKRGHDYESIKKTISTKMWEQVLSLYPHLRDKDEFMELGTPLSNNYYLGSTKGEIYGLDHNIERFCNPELLMHLRPECEIPGLMLTGQDVLTGGFTGAMFGGVICASKCLNRNLLDDILALKKVIDKKK